MKIFVTGGSGYLGHAVVPLLLGRGHQVSALARSDDAAATVTQLGGTPVRGGLTDAEVLTAAAAAADGVIHLGSTGGSDSAEVDAAAAAALQAGIGDRPYVHTGGAWVYGDTVGVVDESAPFAPPAITAWRPAAEEVVLGRGGHPVIVMPGVVYGRSSGLLETFFVEPARKDGAVPVIGDGANHILLVHVDDVAELYVQALEAPAGSRFAGVTEAPVFRDVALALARAAGVPGQLRELDRDEAEQAFGPLAGAFALDQQVSGEAARSALGWAPTHLDAVAELGAA